jgi:hypothetical protein
MNPRIRIHTKMSWIRNTSCKVIEFPPTPFYVPPPPQSVDTMKTELPVSAAAQIYHLQVEAAGRRRYLRLPDGAEPPTDGAEI